MQFKHSSSQQRTEREGTHPALWGMLRECIGSHPALEDSEWGQRTESWGYTEPNRNREHGMEADAKGPPAAPR